MHLCVNNEMILTISASLPISDMINQDVINSPVMNNDNVQSGGRIVDPVEQLRQLLLQAVPVANAVVPPALAYQALPPVVAQVHQAPAPPPNVPQLNLGAAANNTNAVQP
jgi:hypothetical protein